MFKAELLDPGGLMIIFAHLGGIDEVGIYVIPILLAMLSLQWVEKRAKAAAEEMERDQISRRRWNEEGDS